MYQLSVLSWRRVRDLPSLPLHPCGNLPGHGYPFRSPRPTPYSAIHRMPSLYGLGPFGFESLMFLFSANQKGIIAAMLHFFPVFDTVKYAAAANIQICCNKKQDNSKFNIHQSKCKKQGAKYRYHDSVCFGLCPIT